MLRSAWRRFLSLCRSLRQGETPPVHLQVSADARPALAKMAEFQEGVDELNRLAVDLLRDAADADEQSAGARLRFVERGGPGEIFLRDGESAVRMGVRFTYYRTGERRQILTSSPDEPVPPRPAEDRQVFEVKAGIEEALCRGREGGKRAALALSYLPREGGEQMPPVPPVVLGGEGRPLTGVSLIYWRCPVNDPPQHLQDVYVLRHDDNDVYIEILLYHTKPHTRPGREDDPGGAAFLTIDDDVQERVAPDDPSILGWSPDAGQWAPAIVRARKGKP